MRCGGGRMGRGDRGLCVGVRREKSGGGEEREGMGEGSVREEGGGGMGGGDTVLVGEGAGVKERRGRNR